MTEYLKELAKLFDKRGFETYVCEDTRQAIEAISKIISQSDTISSIGIGNSVTIKNMGLLCRLLRLWKN